MPAAIASRCLLHSQREAVARCPVCRQSYCRECITEHEGRVICAACLRKVSQPEIRPARTWGWLMRPVHLLTGILMGWLIFYCLGRVLLLIPSEWHEGTKAMNALSR